MLMNMPSGLGEHNLKNKQVYFQYCKEHGTASAAHFSPGSFVLFTGLAEAKYMPCCAAISECYTATVVQGTVITGIYEFPGFTSSA